MLHYGSPLMDLPPPIVAHSGPPVLSQESKVETPMRRFIGILLSLFLGAFLVDALLSFLDDSLGLFARLHLLGAPRAGATLLVFLLGSVVYLLAGLTRSVPKRCFVPLALFSFLGPLLLVPVLIYDYSHLEQGAWGLSGLQLLLALGALWWAKGSLSLRWPLVRAERLGPDGFGWFNLAGFAAANLFLLAPGVALYLAVCSSLAVGHYSGGFLALGPDGLTARSMKFVRDDGKSIELIPMMHVAEPGFYSRVMGSFPTNSLVLLEGVSDESHLIQEKLSYKRLANSLGLVEQQSGFNTTPSARKQRRADVDVSQFSKTTIDLLNLAARIHAEGMRSPAFLEAIQRGEDPAVTKQLWEDILTGRNRHLLEEIQAGLREADVLVVPWGAAHMPGVAEGIRKFGFSSSDTKEFEIFRFRTVLSRLFSRR